MSSSSSLNDRVSQTSAPVIPTRSGAQTGPLKLAFPTPAGATLSTQDTVVSSMPGAKAAAPQDPRSVAFIEPTAVTSPGDIHFPDASAEKSYLPSSPAGQALAAELARRQNTITEADIPPDMQDQKEQMIRDAVNAQNLDTQSRVLIAEKAAPLSQLIQACHSLFNGNGQIVLSDDLRQQLAQLNALLAPLYRLGQDPDTGALSIADKLGNTYSPAGFLDNLNQMAQETHTLLQEQQAKHPELSTQAMQQGLEQLSAQLKSTDLNVAAVGAGQYAHPALDFLKQVDAAVQAGSSLEDACKQHFKPEVFAGHYQPDMVQDASGNISYQLRIPGKPGLQPGSAADLVRYMADHAQTWQHELAQNAQAAHQVLSEVKDVTGLAVGTLLSEISETSDRLLREGQKLDDLRASSARKREQIGRSQAEVGKLEADLHQQTADYAQIEALDQALASGQSPEDALKLAGLNAQNLSKLGLSKKDGQWFLNGRAIKAIDLSNQLSRVKLAMHNELGVSASKLAERQRDLQKQSDQLVILRANLAQQQQQVIRLRQQLEARQKAARENPAAAQHPDYQHVMAKADAALKQADDSLGKADQELDQIDQTLQEVEILLKHLDATLVQARNQLTDAQAAEQHSQMDHLLEDALAKARQLAKATLHPAPQGLASASLLPAQEMVQLAHQFEDQRRTMLLAQFAASLIESHLLVQNKTQQDQALEHHLQKLQSLLDHGHQQIAANLTQLQASSSEVAELQVAVTALQPMLAPEVFLMLEAGVRS